MRSPAGMEDARFMPSRSEIWAAAPVIWITVAGKDWGQGGGYAD